MTLCVPTPPADNGVLRLRTARGWVSATAADGTVILEQVVAAGEASSAAVARPAEGGEGGGAPTHRLVNKTIVRVDSALTSKKACVLKPGEEVTVLEQRTLESGTTRLRIDRGWLSEATSAGVAIVEPIGQPPPPPQQPSDQPSQKAPAKGAGAQRRRQPQPQQREEEEEARTSATAPPYPAQAVCRWAFMDHGRCPAAGRLRGIRGGIRSKGVEPLVPLLLVARSLCGRTLVCAAGTPHSNVRACGVTGDHGPRGPLEIARVWICHVHY